MAPVLVAYTAGWFVDKWVWDMVWRSDFAYLMSSQIFVYRCYLKSLYILDCVHIQLLLITKIYNGVFES